MPVQALLTLGFTISTTILLAGGWLRTDLVGLLVLVILGISRIVTPEQALAGFSESAVITILAISVIAEGLHQTGISMKIGQFMKKVAGENENRLIMVVTLSGAFLSLFMNNIAAMSVLLPSAMSLSRQTRLSPSRLLMPLAFGVIAGGMATLFTTSNIITSSSLKDAGFQPFGILDFLPIGLPIIIISVVYMRFIGKKLLPDRDPAGMAKQFHHLREELLHVYDLDSTIREISVLHGSGLAGLSIREGDWSRSFQLNVIGITRNGMFISNPEPGTIVNEGDILLIQGDPSPSMLEFYGLKLHEEKPVAVEIFDDRSSLAEIALAPHSNLVGKTLREIHFREKFNLTVLALWRSGRPIHVDVASLPLQVGDGLLIRGSSENFRILNQEHDFLFLEEDPDEVRHSRKAYLAGIIGLVTLIAGISGWLPISLACLGGAVAMILTGCLNMDEAYSSMDWKAIFLIAGLWPLSTAINSSGLSNQIVDSLLYISKNQSPFILVSILLLVTLILTNIMAGQAAVPIILAPIGLTLAQSTGLDPRILLMTIAMGCSLAFPTPIGHPVNVLVMGSGGYTYKDFLKVGFPLTVFLFFVILVGLHLFWGL
jgi:di/tricarboxylate transporter